MHIYRERQIIILINMFIHTYMLTCVCIYIYNVYTSVTSVIVVIARRSSSNNVYDRLA